MSCMKKSSLLVVISIFCFVIQANAQLPHFGVKAGLNLATIYGFEMYPGAQYTKALRPGLIAGAYMTYDVIPLLSIQPEVLYSMKGIKSNNESSITSFDYTFSYNYVEIPVLLKLNLPIGTIAPFKTNIFAGPDFAFNVAAKEEIIYQPPSPYQSQTSTYDLKPSTKPFDFNLAVGAGAGYDIGPTTVGLELRYTFGTGGLNKSGTADYRNGVFAAIASIGI